MRSSTLTPSRVRPTPRAFPFRGYARARAGAAFLALVLAAGGATLANASLQTSTSAKVTLARAGAPAKLVLRIVNADTALVPERVSSVVITSRTAKFNSKAVARCKTRVPTNVAGDNNAAEINPPCPARSRVGKGTWVVNTGTPGQPIPSDMGTLTGTMNIYNYKKSSSEQAAVLMELKSDIPVANAHQYIRAGISSRGVVTAVIPNTADLPPAIANFLRNPDLSYRTTSLARASVTITSPRPPAGRSPFLTLKSTKNIDLSVTLNRD